MIRQIRRLTHPVPALGPGALALTIYAEAADGRLRPRPAAETGYEGVACVDDAARAAGLYALIWRRHQFPWARRSAEGLLTFVCAMQHDSGAFANFILDWDGRRNLTGATSHLGGWPWTVRAMHALALGVSAFGTREYIERFERGLPCLDEPIPYMDLRAVTVLAALEYWTATGATHAGTRALAWAEEIAATRIGDLLPDLPGRTEVHLWGHLQEAALARVGMAFGRTDLIEIACRGADALLVPMAERAFVRPSTLPFDVSCTVAGLDAVARASGAFRYARLAAEARTWFDGRNAARRPVYDRARGLVHDGIDGGQINGNSGAESNIEGALALLDWLPWTAYAEGDAELVAGVRRTRR